MALLFRDILKVSYINDVVVLRFSFNAEFQLCLSETRTTYIWNGMSHHYIVRFTGDCSYSSVKASDKDNEVNTKISFQSILFIKKKKEHLALLNCFKVIEHEKIV